MEKISDIIKGRIKSVGRRFHSNDNIAEFMHDGDLEKIQAEVQEKFQGVLDSLVIDTENDHNTQETAKRVAKMYVQEIFGGRFKKAPKITAFPNMGTCPSRFPTMLIANLEEARITLLVTCSMITIYSIAGISNCPQGKLTIRL